MQILTLSESVDLAIKNGHSLFDIPMKVGKRMGDMTSEDLMKEVKTAKRLTRVYSKRADAFRALAKAGLKSSILGLQFSPSDDRVLAEDRAYPQSLQEWAESPVA